MLICGCWGGDSHLQGASFHCPLVRKAKPVKRERAVSPQTGLDSLKLLPHRSLPTAPGVQVQARKLTAGNRLEESQARPPVPGQSGAFSFLSCSFSVWIISNCLSDMFFLHARLPGCMAPSTCHIPKSCQAEQPLQPVSQIRVHRFIFCAPPSTSVQNRECP